MCQSVTEVLTPLEIVCFGLSRNPETIQSNQFTDKKGQSTKIIHSGFYLGPPQTKSNHEIKT